MEKKKIPERPLWLKGLFERSYLDATLPREQRLGEKEIMFKKWYYMQKLKTGGCKTAKGIFCWVLRR